MEHAAPWSSDLVSAAIVFPSCVPPGKHADNLLLIMTLLFVIGFLRRIYSFPTHNLKTPPYRSSQVYGPFNFSAAGYYRGHLYVWLEYFSGAELNRGILVCFLELHTTISLRKCRMRCTRLERWIPRQTQYCVIDDWRWVRWEYQHAFKREHPSGLWRQDSHSEGF